MICPYCRKGTLIFLFLGIIWCSKCNEWLFDAFDDIDP